MNTGRPERKKKAIIFWGGVVARVSDKRSEVPGLKTQSFVFEKCRRALLEIALHVEPRSAVLEKLRGAINHSHSIMKHIIGHIQEL
jgi:hypothetical protein